MHLAFTTGGEPGARLLHHLGRAACGDTVLAHLRAYRFADFPNSRVLSVDDCAFRQGHTYGSILVDLERHRAIDLLPDRSGDQLASWLAAHVGVEIMSRDRSNEYAHAAQRVAPQVRQVADRFHLLHNLREVLFRVFKRHARLVRQVRQVLPPGEGDRGLSSLRHLRVDREVSRERVQSEMEERFTAVQRLAHEGMNKAAIARTLGLNWQAVRKYSTYTTPPQRSYTVRHTSVLMPYQGYILGRWANGCQNTRQLWREITAQGYPGGYRTIARLTGSLRRRERLGAALPSVPLGLTPGQAAGLAVARPDSRGPREQEVLAQLGSLHPHLKAALELFSSFAALLRSPPGTVGAAEHLQEWIRQADVCGIPELHAFATKLRQDHDAVVGALALPYSQGQTEGFITKLKLLKRSMYGRATLDLLRARVLYAGR